MSAPVGNQLVEVVVSQVSQQTPRVRSFELRTHDGWPLPPFTAGAHVDVHLSSGQSRQYSLASDPGEPGSYRLGVLREADGRGGSVEVHETFHEGLVLGLSLPRNNFPLAAQASHHLLVAGGIGITPFLSMIPVLERQGASWELHYCTRSQAETPFLDELRIGERANHVRLYHDDAQQLDLPHLLAERREGTHAYCCGPARMLDCFFDSSTHWPDDAVHHERFGAEAVGASEEAYSVRLAQSGIVVQVAPGQSLSNALKAACVPVKTGCEAGICGACKTGYVEGHPIHRDFVLSAADRGKFLMTCVSLGTDGDLVLDL